MYLKTLNWLYWIKSRTLVAPLGNWTVVFFLPCFWVTTYFHYHKKNEISIHSSLRTWRLKYRCSKMQKYPFIKRLFPISLISIYNLKIFQDVKLSQNLEGWKPPNPYSFNNKYPFLILLMKNSSFPTSQHLLSTRWK